MSTPRFDLDTYQQGDQQWSHTDTVEFVDEHSIDRGPVSERPTSGEYDDEFYYATDQNVLWSWDVNVSDWIIRGGTGSEEQPLDSVHTEQANITSTFRDMELVHIDGFSTETDSIQTLTISSQFDVYIFQYSLAGGGSSGDMITLRFDGDSDANSNYSYFNESGEKTEDSDEFPLFTTNNDYGGGSGTVWIYDEARAGGGAGRTAISHEFGGKRVDRVTTYLDTGGRDVTEDISQIDIEILSLGECVGDLWGVIGR